MGHRNLPDEVRHLEALEHFHPWALLFAPNQVAFDWPAEGIEPVLDQWSKAWLGLRQQYAMWHEIVHMLLERPRVILFKTQLFLHHVDVSNWISRCVLKKDLANVMEHPTGLQRRGWLTKHAHGGSQMCGSWKIAGKTQQKAHLFRMHESHLSLTANYHESSQSSATEPVHGKWSWATTTWATGGAVAVAVQKSWAWIIQIHHSVWFTKVHKVCLQFLWCQIQLAFFVSIPKRPVLDDLAKTLVSMISGPSRNRHGWNGLWKSKQPPTTTTIGPLQSQIKCHFNGLPLHQIQKLIQCSTQLRTLACPRDTFKKQTLRS